jgi:hypothetical protein
VGFLKGGDAGVGGGGELVECALVVGADAGGLLGPMCLLGVGDLLLLYFISLCNAMMI